MATKTTKTTKKTEGEGEILISRHERGSITVAVMGETPFICNSMSAKTKQSLLLPPDPRNAAARAMTLKHDPLREYRDSIYASENPLDRTLIMHLTSAWKNALRAAALDVPGSKKSEIGRRVWVHDDWVHLFGVPKLLMSPVRTADMNHTPDIRTRAILPHWACVVRISYVKPLLNETAVVNLLANAGLTNGMGDWRQEKGSGNYGAFYITDPEDPEYLEVLAEGKREAQIEAMEHPDFYDAESRKLYEWFYGELERRGRMGQSIRGQNGVNGHSPQATAEVYTEVVEMAVAEGMHFEDEQE